MSKRNLALAIVAAFEISVKLRYSFADINRFALIVLYYFKKTCNFGNQNKPAIEKRRSMGKETERKFLVKNRSFEKEATEIIPISQGYICNEQDKNVRIRVAGDHALITIKGKATGFSRPEFEYPVPVEDAYEIIDLFCDVTIQKKRYLVHYDNNTWEVDVFEGENEGLILAEIELPDEKFTFKKPDWLGWEVTGNPDYYNAMLIKKPYKRWNKKG